MRSSPTFARYTLATLGVVLGVILWGAYVRASGAGAGCGEHWPVCNGTVIPREPSVQTLIEYTHRVTSGLSLLMVLVLWVWARRSHPSGHTVRQAAGWSVVLMLSEAALGAALVLLKLVALDASARRGVAMSLHLLNTFLLLAALGTCAFHALRGPVKRPGQIGALLTTGLVGFVVLGISGAVAALGDTLVQLQVKHPFVDLLISLRIAHPLLALAELAVLASAAVGLWFRRPDTRRPLTSLGGAFLLQLAVGVLNVELQAPVWLQIIHLLIADLTWLSLVVVTRAARMAPAESSEELNPALRPA